MAGKTEIPGQLPSAPSKAERVRADVYALLEVDIRYKGWELQTGEKKAFHVRGFTWFLEEVMRNRVQVTDCDKFISDMKAELAKREAWLATPFNWSDTFGPRQFIDTASPNRQFFPKFHKAAEIILLCETIARIQKERDEGSPHPDLVYEYMRIEPAVSFIHGFAKATVDALSPEQKVALRQWTGQRGNDVFYDMGMGKTVTHKLAQRTLNFFENRVPDVELGDIDFRLVAKRKCKPSTFENVDVKDTDLPEATFAPKQSQ